MPEPAHRHLPAWVRRTFAQAQPILSDLLGSVDGEPRAELLAGLTEVTQLISTGKFSAAWRYPELIDLGQRLYEKQSREKVQADRERRAVEGVRRKAADLLRDPGVALPAEATTRLNRELRAAADQAAIEEVSSRIREAIASARAVQEKRREREIHKTRARIQRSPAGGRRKGPADEVEADAEETAGEPATDSWQDVLAKLKAQMSTEGGQSDSSAAEG